MAKATAAKTPVPIPGEVDFPAHVDEQGYTGSRLTTIGVITLLAALTFLYFISPMGTPH